MINRTLKSILLITLLGYTIPFMAMDTQTLAGTVIDPINYTGQFTVSAFEKPNIASFDVIGSTQELAKTKGLPVVVSLGISKIPWWALTTGTGFLLLTQVNITDPIILEAALDGIGYATGETAVKNIAHFTSNKQAASVATTALVAALYATAYACPGVACITTIANAAATTAVIQALASSTQSLLGAYQGQAPSFAQTTSSSSWLTSINEYYKTAAGMLLGAVGSYALKYQYIKKALEIIDPRVAVKILLYEQAYRLAQAGVRAAQEFFTTTPQLKSKPFTNPILEV